MQPRSTRSHKALAFIGAAAVALSTIAFAAPSQAVTNLIVDFESSDSHVKTGGDALFGGLVGSEITSDSPTGGFTSLKLTSNSEYNECWTGTIFYINNSYTLIDADNRNVSVTMWSPSGGRDIKLKFENTDNTGISVETDLASVQGWYTYNFQLPAPAAAMNRAVLFPDFTCGWGSPQAGASFYIDSVTFPATYIPPVPPRVATKTLLTFESGDALGALAVGDNSGQDATGTFGGTVSSLMNAPTGGADTQSLQVTKHSGSQCWAGVGLLDTRNGSTRLTNAAKGVVTMNFYSSIDRDITVMLKLESPGGVEVSQTAHKGWQVLTFDMAASSSWHDNEEYKMLSLFPNFCGANWSAGADDVFYIDNVAVNGATTPIPTAPKMPVAPKVDAEAVVGRSVGVKLPSISGVGTPTITYKWYLCSKGSNVPASSAPKDCKLMASQTGATLTITKSMRGKYIRAAVKATNGLGSVTRVTGTTRLVV